MAASSLSQWGGFSVRGGWGSGNEIMGAFASILLAQACFSAPGVGFCTRMRLDLPRSLLAITLQFLAINFARLPTQSRYLAFACSWSRWESMGDMYVSASRTGIGVALKAPAGNCSKALVLHN